MFVKYPGDSNQWKVIRRLPNQGTNIIPPLRISSQLVTTDEEKCNIF